LLILIDRRNNHHLQSPMPSNMAEEREEFLTARQLAQFLQVSESTVRRLAAKRRIPSVRLTPRIIRFHLDAVREALDVPKYRIRHGEYDEQVDDAQLTFDDFLLS
jgi:excisionase family DNA binding protein